MGQVGGKRLLERVETSRDVARRLDDNLGALADTEIDLNIVKNLDLDRLMGRSFQ